MQYELLTTVKCIFFRIKYNFSDSNCNIRDKNSIIWIPENSLLKSRLIKIN